MRESLQNFVMTTAVSIKVSKDSTIAGKKLGFLPSKTTNHTYAYGPDLSNE